ncbi:MAG: NAD(P)H-dependent flavin oxidoreductase [Puniceicoccaceae bacterium]
MNTVVTQKLGIRHPIIQGPFGGGLSTVELAATVSNAGGMGSYGAHLLTPGEIEDVAAGIRARTAGPFALNLWVDSLDARARDAKPEDFERAADELKPVFECRGIAPPSFMPPEMIDFGRQMEAILRARPPVFSFVFGIPDGQMLSECRQHGIRTIGAATTLDEAQALEAAGVDFVLATGFEAGGHRPSFLRPAEDSLHGTLALVRQMVTAVKIPVIAAGGIADAAGVAAALKLDAGAVQVGTAFLACEESGAPPLHKEFLFSPSARRTRLSNCVSGRLARFVVTPALEELEQLSRTHLGYPLQSALTRPLKLANAGGDKVRDGLFYAGQGAPLLRHRKATELIAELLKEIVR